MYDIIRWEVEGQDSTVVVFADLKERGLFDSLNQLTQQQGYGDPQHPGKLSLVTKVFFAVYHAPTPFVHETPFFGSEAMRFGDAYFSIASYHQEIEHPPQSLQFS